MHTLIKETKGIGQVMSDKLDFKEDYKGQSYDRMMRINSSKRCNNLNCVCAKQ